LLITCIANFLPDDIDDFVQKQNIEIQELRRHFQDELIKQKAGVELDLNLEKSRAKDAVYFLLPTLCRLK
jgi:hypothetical protein